MAGDKKTIKFQMMMSPSEAEALDDWGFAHRIRSRAEAIRQLIRRGMMYEVTDEYGNVGRKIIVHYMRGQVPPDELIADYMELGEKIADQAVSTADLAYNTIIELTAFSLIEENKSLSYEEALAIAKEKLPARVPDYGPNHMTKEKRLEQIALLRASATKPK